MGKPPARFGWSTTNGRITRCIDSPLSSGSRPFIRTTKNRHHRLGVVEYRSIGSKRKSPLQDQSTSSANNSHDTKVDSVHSRRASGNSSSGAGDARSRPARAITVPVASVGDTADGLGGAGSSTVASTRVVVVVVVVVIAVVVRVGSRRCESGRARTSGAVSVSGKWRQRRRTGKRTSPSGRRGQRSRRIRWGKLLYVSQKRYAVGL